MTKLEYLQRARRRIAQGWIREAPARTEDNRITHPNAGDARGWCLTGGLGICVPNPAEGYPRALQDAWAEVEGAVPILPANWILCKGVSPAQVWNDSFAADQSEVLALLDRLIQAELERGPECSAAAVRSDVPLRAPAEVAA